MRKKVLILGLCLLGVTHSLSSKDKKSIPLYKDAKAPIEKRIDDLISRMTLEEKILQLNQYTLGRNNNVNNVGEEVKKVPSEIGSLIYFDINPELRNSMQKKAMEESRLGIPIIFGYDAIHGFRTIYPISLGQACSWNPGLVEQACAVSAQEARMSGVDWTFSPMIDVARDPRWGRVAEGYGEDPYTNGVFAAASVRGYQGDDMSAENRMAACLKHYVGYGASEAGRDYVYTEISAQTLWDTYLLPYEMGVKAGAATLMSSFNDISGVPGSANPYIMTEILKKRWKHDGFIVSDWGAVEQLKNQGLAHCFFKFGGNTKKVRTINFIYLHAGRDYQMLFAYGNVQFVIRIDFIFDDRYLGCFHHTSHKQDTGDHQTYFDGNSQIEYNGEEEGDQQYGHIRFGILQQCFECTPLTHII